MEDKKEHKKKEQQLIDNIQRIRSNSQALRSIKHSNIMGSNPYIEQGLDRLMKEAELEKKKEEQQKFTKLLESKYKEFDELIQKGLDLNLTNKKVPSATEKKVIYKAYLENDVKTIDDFFHKNYEMGVLFETGKTLLHQATIDNNIPFIEYLLTKCFDPNIEDTNGSIPLHYAAKNQNLKTVSLLLWKNNVCISNALLRDKTSKINKFGYIPRDYLNNNQENFDQIERLLIHAEATIKDSQDKVNEQIKSELRNLSRLEQQLLEGFNKHDNFSLEEHLNTMSSIVTCIKNLQTEIRNSIFQSEQKKIFLIKVNAFCKELAENIKTEKYKNEKSIIRRADSFLRSSNSVSKFGLSVPTSSNEKEKEESIIGRPFSR